ncbi:carboxymuconolactone decarboxylase family protein [Martelella endophytica]|uniref:carboxymuconolactone decarboxylase family protein n=1 Tax=Martelella endophytica TaxID=1486262 RepID=UPI00069760A8|nr:carboxymuconolactone decarboxylase family protein [Martelella endophytica]
MTDRMKRSKGGFEPVFADEVAIQGRTLEPLLIQLAKLRASQINGCAFCIRMHVAQALTGCDI